jgi:hypothetical protein
LRRLPGRDELRSTPQPARAAQSYRQLRRQSFVTFGRVDGLIIAVIPLVAFSGALRVAALNSARATKPS